VLLALKFDIMFGMAEAVENVYLNLILVVVSPFFVKFALGYVSRLLAGMLSVAAWPRICWPLGALFLPSSAQEAGGRRLFLDILGLRT